jgi:hypothetical protein
VHFEADMPERPGTDISLKHRKESFKNKHQLVLKKLRAMKPDPELDNDEVPILGDTAEAGDWQGATRAAAKRQGVGVRIDSVNARMIDQGCGRRTPTPTPVYVNELTDSSMSSAPVYVKEDIQNQPGGTNQGNFNPPMRFQEISHRAGPTGTNHPDLFARCAQIYSIDEDDDPPTRSVWPPPPSSRKKAPKSVHPR